MNLPDPSLFLVNRRIGEYEADFAISGTVSVSISAQSLDDAKAKADDMCDDDDFGLELDEVDDVCKTRVFKKPALYLVMRGGDVMQVSCLQDGDLPRQPTDYEARELARQDALAEVQP